jgi:hypothetical protein
MQLNLSVAGKLVASELSIRIVFAFISTLIVLILIDIPIKRYNLELQEGQILHKSTYGAYLADDLDFDGNTERVHIYNSMEAERLTIMLLDVEGLIKETVNFIHHDWNTNSSPEVYDIDEDGIKDLIIVSIKNDSVYLNAVNLFTSEFTIPNLLLGVIERPMPQMAYRTDFLAYEDLNNDGYKEMFFAFDAGYGLNPRGLYRYDVLSKTLYSTPKSYIVWNTPVFKDLNHDGIPEILAWNYAPSNVTFETEYTDTRAWIGAFDLDLNYLFPPIRMPEGYGYVYTSPVTFSDSLYFAIYSNRSSDSIPNRIFLLDYHGNILKEKSLFKDDPTFYTHVLGIFDNKNYLLINNIGQFELTAELDNLPQQKIKQQKNYNPYLHLKPWPVDVNGDGRDELIYYNLNTSVLEILNDRYKILTSFILPFERLRITNIYPYLVNGITERLMVVTDSGYFFMRYSENPFYWTKYMVWLGIFLSFWGFIYLVQFFQRRRMEQKWETEKKLTELQFNTIRNQLNPHFIFNALNSVGYLIENGKKDEAYNYLTINSRLIRKVLEDADLTVRPLADEIKFVKDYLTIQKFRFRERFETVFSIDEKVNLKLAVPKMVLHTYVENAIKHAFGNMHSGGKLEIEVTSISKGVELKVRDNGIKDKNSVPTESTGKGISIMESYYRIFEKQHQCNIRTGFSKLNERDANLNGTEVTIQIEYKSG